jgi:sugar/nucleoside kinase (ribokinase family)
MAERRIAHLLVSRGDRGVRLHTLTAEGSVRRVEQAPRHVLAVRDTTGAGDRLLAAVLERADREPSLAATLPGALDAVSRALKERP